MTGKTIALFDDDIDIRELLTYNLIRSGYKVVTFPTPLNGYNYITKNKPDIILSDWLMPEMNGLDFCRKLKSDLDLKEIPLIMISCKGDRSDIKLALENGADEYLVKPFRINELLDKIKQMITNKDHLIN